MRKRFAGAVVGMGLIASACVGSSPQDSVVATSSTPPPRANTSTTDGAPRATTEVPRATTTPVPSSEIPLADAVVLGRLAPIQAPAPVVLADGPKQLDAHYDLDFRSGPEAPVGASYALVSCAVVGPGVKTFDFETAGDVEYPYEVRVVASTSRGDIGTGVTAIVEIPGPGIHRFVSSIPDTIAVGVDQRFENAGDDESARLIRGFRASEDRCSLSFGSDRSGAGAGDMTFVPVALEMTAPAGTLEALGQAAFADSSSPFELFAQLYGEAKLFFTETWFLPDNPTQLERVSEELRPDGCLTLSMKYERYEVIQQRGCGVADTPAVYGAGAIGVAVASDGDSLVRVYAEGELAALAVAGSLSPFWLMTRKQVPLAPIDESVIATATIDGRDLIVTIGEQRACATGSCFSPGQWFFVYERTERGLADHANYPAFNACGVVIEESFVFAIAPRRGFIELEDASGTTVINESDGRWGPAILRVTAPDLVDVRILGEDGDEPRCVDSLNNDNRGGVENLAGGPDEAVATRLPGFLDVVTEACDGVPRQVDRVTNHEPLGVACADIDGRTVTVALVLPNRQLVAPPKRAQPEGYVCIPIHFGSGLSNDCVMEGETLRVQHSSFDEVGVSWAALVVGDDVSSVVAITEMGTVVTTVPHDGIAFLWWPSEAGDLFRAAAESPDGFTSMFPDPEHD